MKFVSLKKHSSRLIPAVAVHAPEIIQFLISGGFSTFVHWTVLGLLISEGLMPVMATIIGACVGSICNYCIQFYWTFKGDGIHGRALPAYICIVLLGWLINAALFYILTSIAQTGSAMAQICATAATAVMNFIVYKKVVFHERISR